MLIGNKISQRYGDIEVINNVDISVSPGGVTVLLGKSGAGKSTLIRTISLIDKPYSGEIILDDVNIFPQKREQEIKIWPYVTVVFQQFFLWPHLLVKENIVLPLRLRDGIPANAHEIFHNLGIEELLNRYPNQVSVGQRQRIALARAILLNPKYLLIDEITSAQDVQHISAILELLKVLINSGLGLVVVSHHLGFIRNLLSVSSRSEIIYLENGKIMEKGDIETLDNPATSSLKEFIRLSRELK